MYGCLLTLRSLFSTKDPLRHRNITSSFYPQWNHMRRNQVLKLSGKIKHLQHVEVPSLVKLEVKLVLQLLAYATAKEMQDLSYVCDLHHSSKQCQILNLLNRTRDWICILMDTSQFHFLWVTMKIPNKVLMGLLEEELNIYLLCANHHRRWSDEDVVHNITVILIVMFTISLQLQVSWPLISETTFKEHKMGHSNNVTQFVLLGLIQNPEGQKSLFILFSLIYLVMILGNLLILVTLFASPSLGSPLYFFIAYLLFMDEVYSMVIFPKLITDLLCGKKTISFPVFMGHLFLDTCLGVLRSSFWWWCPMITMWPSVSHCTTWPSWINRCASCCCQRPGLEVLHTQWFNISFCGPNAIDHCICDIYPPLVLAYTNTSIAGFSVIANGGAICMVIFLLLTSYGVILNSLNTQGQEGSHKALTAIPILWWWSSCSLYFHVCETCF